jgi:ribosomal protein S18 acetylase RimI-like enzyme
MSITIRPPTAADAPIIAEFNARLAWETEGKKLDPSTAVRGVHAQLADPAKGWYVLACEGNDVVGQLAVTFEWSDWKNGWFWWIQSVYVRADARGRGVFRSLFQHVADRAKSAGNVTAIRLYVERENDKAQNTYRSLGMEKTSYEVYNMAIE